MTPDTCDRRCLQAIHRHEAYRRAYAHDSRGPGLRPDRARDEATEVRDLRRALTACGGDRNGHGGACEGTCADVCGVASDAITLDGWPWGESPAALGCLRDAILVARGDRPEIGTIAIRLGPDSWLHVDRPYVAWGRSRDAARADVDAQRAEDRRETYPPMGGRGAPYTDTDTCRRETYPPMGGRGEEADR